MSPTVTEVAQIAAVTTPILRNLQITQCYHELALALTARTGICANWCTFATWASKQAGQTIRKEDFARTLENLLRQNPQIMSDLTTSARSLGSTQSAADIHESVLDLLNPMAAFNRAADAVARGNKKVFEEIGREFARFAAECLNDSTFDAAKIAQFCDGLRAGNPPDGQDYLRRAFTCYYHALFASDPKTRAELMLLANIEIGFHEQTRLQPEIAEAMNAAWIERREFQRRFITALFPGARGWIVRLRLFFLRLLNRSSRIDAVIDVLLAEAQRRARLIITEYLMTLGVPPDVILRLGDDLPVTFPDSLKEIVLTELVTLLTEIDPTPDSPRDSGTVDWSELPDRLHFIVDLFRCYHEAAELFETPFTAEQVAAMRAGRVPEGRL